MFLLGLFAAGWRVTGRDHREVVLAFGRRLLLSALQTFARICDRGASDSGERRERMNLAASWTHDVFGANSANSQGICDERAVTAPRHSFSTHQCDAVLVR